MKEQCNPNPIPSIISRVRKRPIWANRIQTHKSSGHSITLTIDSRTMFPKWGCAFQDQAILCGSGLVNRCAKTIVWGKPNAKCCWYGVIWIYSMSSTIIGNAEMKTGLGSHVSKNASWLQSEHSVYDIMHKKCQETSEYWNHRKSLPRLFLWLILSWTSHSPPRLEKTCSPAHWLPPTPLQQQHVHEHTADAHLQSFSFSYTHKKKKGRIAQSACSPHFFPCVDKVTHTAI